MDDASEKNGPAAAESVRGWAYKDWQLTLRSDGALMVGNDEYGTTFPSDVVADLVTGATWRALHKVERWYQEATEQIVNAIHGPPPPAFASPVDFGATPAARFRMVTPDRWSDIGRDSFVFGQVAAAAFAAYAPVRLTRDGFLFEAVEAELSDEDLQRIGGKLDAAAERAFEQRAALDVAKTLATGWSGKPEPEKPRRYIVAREAFGEVPPRGDDLGCYDSFGEANDAAREMLRIEMDRERRGNAYGLPRSLRDITPVLVFDGDVVLTRWTATGYGARVEVQG